MCSTRTTHSHRLFKGLFTQCERTTTATGCLCFCEYIQTGSLHLTVLILTQVMSVALQVSGCDFHLFRVKSWQFAKIRQFNAWCHRALFYSVRRSGKFLHSILRLLHSILKYTASMKNRLSSDKGICALSNQVQGRQNLRKLFAEACFGMNLRHNLWLCNSWALLPEQAKTFYSHSRTIFPCWIDSATIAVKLFDWAFPNFGPNSRLQLRLRYLNLLVCYSADHQRE